MIDITPRGQIHFPVLSITRDKCVVLYENEQDLTTAIGGKRSTNVRSEEFANVSEALRDEFARVPMKPNSVLRDLAELTFTLADGVNQSACSLSVSIP